MQLAAAELLAIEREYCKRSLANFAKRAWHVLEPSTPLVWGWSLDAICDHLEAVTRGDIRRLLINVPPGCMKSLLTGVLWPAWEWGAKDQPGTRIIGTAYKQDLAIRDSTKMRRLIQSDWHQSLWPIVLTSDQNAKTKFDNDKTGFREATAFKSTTGSRGDRVILDDPISVEDANSVAELDECERIFTETLPTRVNNDNSAIVVIMQRVNSRDTSGLIISRNLGYTHLCLPMRFEADRRCFTSIGFADPRKDDGDLLFPERFSEKTVAELEAVLGSYASAGQLQQRPAPRDGGMFKRDWFRVVKAVPAGTRFVRGWDLAATNAGGDWTAGAKIGRQPDGRFVIADIVFAQYSPAGVERLIVNTASQDGYGCEISLPQDPGGAGKQQAQYLILALAGYNVHATSESGSKEIRANPLAAQMEAGNVDILEGDWNQKLIEQACLFPNGDHDDLVDACSRAFNVLVTQPFFDLEALT